MCFINLRIWIYLAGPLLLLAGCKSQLPLTLGDQQQVAVLCGEYLAADSSDLMLRLEFKNWNTVALSTPFDGMASAMIGAPADEPVRPDSRYFVDGDTLYLEMDKGFLCYRIVERGELLGASGWNSDDRLIRGATESAPCPKVHLTTAEDRRWLSHSRAYYRAYYSRDIQGVIPQLEALCEEGYGPACITLGKAVSSKDKERALALLERACETGYFGHYGCFQLGEMLDRYGENEEAAQKAYQKACEGGHAVGCMALLTSQN